MRSKDSARKGTRSPISRRSNRALAALARAARRGSVVVVLSDLIDLPPEAPERISAIATRGRVVVVVQVLDPDEATFPFTETVRLEALEGGATVETDEAARERYLAALGRSAGRMAPQARRARRELPAG